MLTLHRILSPVDFSEPSRRALRHALAIARCHGSELTVLHVEDVWRHAARTQAGGYSELAARHDRDLRDFVNDAGGNDRNVRVQFGIGDAVSGILDHATRDASDLIVIGTNGRSGLARAVLGSVTERVVRQSTVPVLTIPSSAELQASDELMPFDPILCASDFSPACRKALELAILMGQEADARLILLHALQQPDFDPAIMPLSISTGINSSQSRKDALARLNRGLPGDAVFRCRPERVVKEGRPADVILQTASTEDVKLIVMGVQARGALDRLIFGSTTRTVMQAAMCPVLSIRASQAPDAWPAGPRVAPRALATAAIE